MLAVPSIEQQSLGREGPSMRLLCCQKLSLQKLSPQLDDRLGGSLSVKKQIRVGDEGRAAVGVEKGAVAYAVLVFTGRVVEGALIDALQ